MHIVYIVSDNNIPFVDDSFHSPPNSHNFKFAVICILFYITRFYTSNINIQSIICLSLGNRVTNVERNALLPK